MNAEWLIKDSRVVEYLSSMCEALGFIPDTIQKEGVG
jgi:hypothetical protein